MSLGSGSAGCVSQLWMLCKNIQLELARLFVSPGWGDRFRGSSHAPSITFFLEDHGHWRGVQEKSGWTKKDYVKKFLFFRKLWSAAVPVSFSSVLPSPKSDLKVILCTSRVPSGLFDQHKAVLRVHCLHHLGVCKCVCHFKSFIPWCRRWCHTCYCAQSRRRRLARLQQGVIVLLVQNLTELRVALLMRWVAVGMLTLEVGRNDGGKRGVLQLGVVTQVRVIAQGISAWLHHRTERLCILLLVWYGALRILMADWWARSIRPVHDVHLVKIALQLGLLLKIQPLLLQPVEIQTYIILHFTLTEHFISNICSFLQLEIQQNSEETGWRWQRRSVVTLSADEEKSFSKMPWRPHHGSQYKNWNMMLQYTRVHQNSCSVYWASWSWLYNIWLLPHGWLTGL